jgi:hypothetical protein
MASTALIPKEELTKKTSKRRSKCYLLGIGIGVGAFVSGERTHALFNLQEKVF